MHRQSAAVLGIINSDILFEPAAAWRDLEQLVAQKSVVTGQRCDTKSLAGGALHRYHPGFDYFFFDQAAAEDLASDTRPFSMGLPWWDYWLPVTLALRGYEIRCVARPTILHLAHEMPSATRSAAWRRLAVEFARAVLSEWESSRAPPPQWEDLLSLCRELAQASDSTVDAGELDQRIGHLAELSVPVIAGNIVELDDGAPALSPPSARATWPARSLHSSTTFPDGLPRATPFIRAMWHENRQELREAQHFYGLALERAPRDPGILSACGNYCENRGDLERAAALFRRSVELVPDSGILLNSLGSALGELGRRNDAMACFERALKVDPLYAPTYYNLVIGLYPHGRHREIISRLEGLIEDPNFVGGREWLARIRETLSRLENPPVRDAGFRAPR